MNNLFWGLVALAIIVGVVVGVTVHETGSTDALMKPFQRIKSGLQSYR